MRGPVEAGGTELPLPRTPAEHQPWSPGAEEGSRRGFQSGTAAPMISKYPA